MLRSRVSQVPGVWGFFLVIPPLASVHHGAKLAEGEKSVTAIGPSLQGALDCYFIIL